MKLSIACCLAAGGALCGAAGLSAQTKPAPEKAEIVAVAGCLKETSPNNWALEHASDPVSSTANAPSPKELAAIAKSGKNVFRLIGVSEFKLPAHRDHNVLVKGLQIKAAPTNRLNVTSVTMISVECPPKP